MIFQNFAPLAIDTSTNVLMTTIENPILTTFSKIVAVSFDTVSLVIISVLISAYFFYRNQGKKELFFASAMVVSGGVIYFLKELFQRVRPMNQLMIETNFSFPSGHATVSTVFVFLLAYLYTKGKSAGTKKLVYLVAGIIALIVGFTRVYLRVHWLTDVLAGFIIAAVILFGAIFVEKRFRKV
jgi:undecaprenyl-diphosphatase